MFDSLYILYFVVVLNVKIYFVIKIILFVWMIRGVIVVCFVVLYIELRW